MKFFPFIFTYHLLLIRPLTPTDRTPLINDLETKITHQESLRNLNSQGRSEPQNPEPWDVVWDLNESHERVVNLVWVSRVFPTSSVYQTSVYTITSSGVKWVKGRRPPLSVYCVLYSRCPWFLLRDDRSKPVFFRSYKDYWEHLDLMYRLSKTHGVNERDLLSLDRPQRDRSSRLAWHSLPWCSDSQNPYVSYWTPSSLTSSISLVSTGISTHVRLYT